MKRCLRQMNLKNNMENYFDVSVILPIKSGRAFDFSDYFTKCIESLKTQKLKIKDLIIVHTDETQLVDYLNKFDFGGAFIVSNASTKVS